MKGDRGMVCSPNIVELPTKVVPASSEALEKFNYEDLRAYAESLGVETGSLKNVTIARLMVSGKATLCASLGT